MFVSPNVSSAPKSNNAQVFEDYEKKFGIVSVAGARPNQVSFLLDGTDVNDQGGQAPGSAAGGLTGVDSVRELAGGGTRSPVRPGTW